MAQRQIDDVDTELCFVRRHEFQRADDGADQSSAARVEHLDANEIDGRRDALEVPLESRPVPPIRPAACVP